MALEEPKRLTLHDYHVAWICPVQNLELLPARLMLDEEHESPDYDTEYNEYTYIFGEIKRHTVIIATLPQCRTGNISASHLAGQLFRTFRNIRIALLVGISGGIPFDPPNPDPLKDIHLGDVVVGYPLDGRPPFINYQFGRLKPDEIEILRKDRMQDPDIRVLSGLEKLVSDLEFDPAEMKRRFSKQLDRLRKHPVHAHKFRLPSPASDKLFKADNEHVGGWGSCSDCMNLQVVDRPQRQDVDRTTLVFHLGLVANGNYVVQKGRERENIQKLCDGALCIETEAAGIEVNRNCLIIRGISDYADSHKNDEWRQCAAGHAAAFARQLLCTISPGQLRSKETIATQQSPLDLKSPGSHPNFDKVDTTAHRAANAGPYTCYRCGTPGHLVPGCSAKNWDVKNEREERYSRRECLNCGSDEHWWRECRRPPYKPYLY